MAQTRRTKKTAKSEPEDGQKKDLEAIQFLNDEGEALDPEEVHPPEVSEFPERTVEMNARNQAAARRAMETMGRDPEGQLPELRRPKVEPLSEEEALKLKAKIYRVLKDKEIGAGGRRITLRAGKEFSENEYSVESLKQQGVELVEVK